MIYEKVNYLPFSFKKRVFTHPIITHSQHALTPKMCIAMVVALNVHECFKYFQCCLLMSVWPLLCKSKLLFVFSISLQTPSSLSFFFQIEFLYFYLLQFYLFLMYFKVIQWVDYYLMNRLNLA